MSVAAIGGLILQGAKSFFEHRKQRSDAKQERRLAEISEGASYQEGWKDEYLTVTFTAPIWLIIWGAMWNKTELIARSQEAVSVITELPEWYVVALGTILVGSFGLRAYREIKGK